MRIQILKKRIAWKGSKEGQKENKKNKIPVAATFTGFL